VLDLVNPIGTGWWSLGGGWKAGHDDPGQKDTLHHAD
jgi:hypothetical protein